MRTVSEILDELDERSSNGDGLAQEAARCIRYNNGEMRNAAQVADFLGRHKIILRSALVKIVGAENPDELKAMKLALQCALALDRKNLDLVAALVGIQALLDTL